MQKLNDKQLEEREEIIKDMIQKVGIVKTMEWLGDPERLSVINAMAAVAGD